MLLFDVGSILVINQRESEKTVWRADLDKKIYNNKFFLTRQILKKNLFSKSMILEKKLFLKSTILR